MDDLKARIASFLTSYQTNMLQLATSSNNQPWVCNVWYAADDDLQIYWFSSTTRRHSQDIATSPQAAGSICPPQRPGEQAIALQFEGKAQIITDETERQRVYELYQATGVSDAERTAKLAADEKAPHHFYKLTITHAKFFDAVSDPARSPYNEWSRD